MTDIGISTGFTTEEFESVRIALDTLAIAEDGYRAQVCAYWKGRKVIDLAVGPGIDATTLTGVYSASKGAAAMTVALMVQDGVLDLDRTVAHYWPEFAAGGKDGITVRQFLSHQAGLVGHDEGFTIDEYRDTALAAAKLATVRPSWRPGTAFGYHQRTIGIGMEELARRILGTTLQDSYERRIRAPHAIDFFLGLPPELDHRFHPVLPPADTAEPDLAATMPLSLRGVAGNAAVAPLAFPANDPVLRRSGLSSTAGVASADGLARLYAAATTGIDGAPPFLAEDTMARFAEQQVWGLDRVSEEVAAFGVVFQKPCGSRQFGSHRAFGHDGAGGSLGFADPLYDLSFGYVPVRQEEGGTYGNAATIARRILAVIDHLEGR